MTQRQIVVIGGGTAGIEAAAAAAAAGAAVTLISDGPLGGRGGWDSLLPSKVWLQAAAADGPKTDVVAVRARIAAASAGWSVQETMRLRGLGVHVISGVAQFVDAQTVAVLRDGSAAFQLGAAAIIVAAGSLPHFPADMKPDGRRIIAPRHLSSLHEIPSDIAVIGGGATGAETVSLFVALGSRVTWYNGPHGAFAGQLHDTGARLESVFEQRGVTVVHQNVRRAVSNGDLVTITAQNGVQQQFPLVFVAVGRHPDGDRLNAAAAGLPYQPAVDAFGRTAVPHIYIVGDAAGGPMLANRAQAQGWLAGRHAAGIVSDVPPAATIVQAVYSSPEIAWVGTLTAGPNVRRIRVDSRYLLKQYIEPHEALELDLIVNAAGRVIGGLAIGTHAADVINSIAVAVAAELPLVVLANLYAAAPTFSELIGVAARQALSMTAAEAIDDH